jgi:hypothetical protein
MTQEIKREDHPDFVGGWIWSKLEIRWIKERIAEAILAEREACAKACEDGLNIATCLNALDDMEMWGEKFAKAIRARGDIASIIACRDMLDAQPVPPRTTG